MPLSEEEQIQFDQALLNDKRDLINKIQTLGAELTKALGAIDALLLLLTTKGYLAGQPNEITDSDVVGSGKSAADINAAVGAIAGISTAAKDSENNWTALIGKIVRARDLG